MILSDILVFIFVIENYIRINNQKTDYIKLQQNIYKILMKKEAKI